MPSALVIDDEEMVRQSVSLILRTRGWTTELAGDGGEGLSKARANPPDLIICDINMPVMDGLATLEAIRADPKLAKTPVLIITGREKESVERQAFAGGAQALLLKPFSVDALLDLAERALQPDPGPPASL